MTTRTRIVAGAALLLAGYFAYQYATKKKPEPVDTRAPEDPYAPCIYADSVRGADGICRRPGNVDFAGSSPNSPVQDGPVTQPWQV